MSKFNFISGLPRSGSTLLAAILRQNPSFHAGMSSPVGPIFNFMQQAISRKNEAAGFIDNEAKLRLLKGVFDNYYNNKTDVIFDTSRGWTGKLSILTKLFPDLKMICCVRDVNWIIDSIEHKIRNNPTDLSGMFGYDSNGTVFSRAETLTAPGGLIGHAINSLQEAYWGEFSNHLLLIDYEALTRLPNETMKVVYDFTNETFYQHDFDNVNYSADDFDTMLGMPGLHTVRSKVEYIPRQTILPPTLTQRFVNDSFWKNDNLNTKHVPVICIRKQVITSTMDNAA